MMHTWRGNELAQIASSRCAPLGGQEKRQEKEVVQGLYMFNGGGPLTFLTHESVQKDLKMTEQQVKASDAAITAARLWG